MVFMHEYFRQAIFSPTMTPYLLNAAHCPRQDSFFAQAPYSAGRNKTERPLGSGQQSSLTHRRDELDNAVGIRFVAALLLVSGRREQCARQGHMVASWLP